MIYTLLKFLLQPLHRMYYKRIIVEGKENIPRDGVIFTSNHQNAMMDAMAIVAASGRKPWFMARADMFTLAFYRFFLGIFRIIPIYRQRDGKEGLKKNNDVFEQAATMLVKGHSLALFPEAGHAEHRRLQALRKGFVRIGFQALEKSGFDKEIAIIPVGLYYSDFTSFRHTLHVRFGKPVNLSHYKELYEKNPQKAFNIVKSKVAKRIIPMMINIKNQEYYHTFERMVTLYTESLLPELGYEDRIERILFLTKQKVIYLMNHLLEQNPEAFQELRIRLDDYFNDAARLHFNDVEVQRFQVKPVSLTGRAAGLLLLLPFALYGAGVNIIPYIIAGKAAESAGDKHFLSTYKFGISVIAFPVFYALLAWGFSMLPFASIISVISFVLSLPLSGLIAYKWRHWMREWYVNRKLKKAVRRKEGEVYHMLVQRKELLEYIDKIMAPYF